MEKDDGFIKRRFVKRGPNPIDDPSAVKDAIVQNKNDILLNGEIRPPSDEIWEKIKKKYCFKLSTKGLYSYVKCNKFGVQVDLGLLSARKSLISQNTSSSNVIEGKEGNREKEEVFDDDDDDDETENNDMETKDDKSDDFYDEHNQEASTATKGKGSSIFTVYIPKEKWRLIEPEERPFSRNEEGRNDRTRMYNTLKPGIWTDVLNGILWEKLKWSCCWRFKGHHVSKSDMAQFYLVIRGSCDCGNSFKATSPNPPLNNPRDSGLELKVVMEGARESHSIHNTRRQLRGKRRQDLGEEMANKRLRPSFVRKTMASDAMVFGDPYPAQIPSNEVLRKTKSETIKSRRLDDNIFKAVQLLKYSTNPVVQHSIQDIGLDPFFVHFWTPNQIRIYNLYCKKNYSRLIIDATGNVTQKISRPVGNISSHIFLYLGVIRLPSEQEGLVPVVQMLSERHNADAIEFWLKCWLRVGDVPAPSEVVLDDSAALISACCRAFGGETQTSSYITKCLSFLQGNNSMRPKVLIRIDVAHFTNLIRKWPEITRMRIVKVKEFYIRSIILVANAESLKQAEELLKSIFVVALNDTEGNSISSGELTPCEIEKTKLLSLISGVGLPEDIQSQSEEENLSDTEESVYDAIINKNVSPVKNWIENIVNLAKKCVVNDGDRDNIMFEPEMVSKIKHLCYILPLWCNALAKKMSSPFPRAVGAYVEGEIGEIKSCLANKQLRADDFLYEYLKFCDGSVMLAGTTDIVQKHFVEGKKSTRCEDTGSTSNENTKLESIEEISSSVKLIHCLACSMGNFPGGAHKCIQCNKNIHVIDGCSFAIAGEEEGYGERRICAMCYPSTTSSTVIPVVKGRSRNDRQKSVEEVNKKLLTLKTSIVDRHDLSLSSNTKNPTTEPNSIEGWKGLSIPKKEKKQKTAYYWTPNPDFPLSGNLKKQIKIGVLKNGSLPTLKVLKVGLQHVSLANTCSFDAPAQLFATAYSDSEHYRTEIDKNNISLTILEIAKQLATKGVDRSVYQLRSSVLCRYISGTTLKSEVLLVDCAIDSSMLLRRMSMPPSLIETRTCNSPYCPAKVRTKNLNVLTAQVKDSHIGRDVLEAALNFGDSGNISNCLVNMSDVNEVPRESVVIDQQLSIQPLCSGQRTREVQVGCHLLVELVGSEQRPHTDAHQHGVYNFIKLPINTIPRTVTLFGRSFNLRGFIAFKPPLRDGDVGHYVAFSLRLSNKWEVYDDLVQKVKLVSGSEETYVHLLLYTV